MPNKYLITLVATLLVSGLVHAQSQAQPESSLRLISAGGSVTAQLRALGLESSLVGIDSTSVSETDPLPLPNIGYPRQMNAEGLLSLAPDVLIGTEEMGPPGILEQMQQAGVEVLVLSADPSLEALFDNIRLLGTRFQREQAAEALLDDLDARIAALPPVVEPRPEALFLLSHSGSGSILVAGDATAGASLIALGGMRNAVSGRFSQYRALSAESFLALSPEWLLTTSQSLEMAGGSAQLLGLQPALAATPAGRSGQVLGVEGSHMVGGFSPAITGTLAQLRAALAATPE